MWGFFAEAGMAPFSVALALVAGFFVLEIVALLIGGSLLGAEGDAPDAPDIDGPDFDAPDLDGPDIDTPEIFSANLDAPEADLDLEPEIEGASAPGAGGLLAWLGFGRVPFLVWLVSLLTGFGLVGFVMQTGAQALLGGLLNPWLAGALAVVPGLLVAKHVAQIVARLVPKVETSAVSERHLGGRHGAITQGTARRGRPAEARVTDHHGNPHYIRVEPLRDGDELPQGTEIVVLRPVNRIYRAIRLEDRASKED